MRSISGHPHGEGASRVGVSSLEIHPFCRTQDSFLVSLIVSLWRNVVLSPVVLSSVLRRICYEYVIMTGSCRKDTKMKKALSHKASDHTIALLTQTLKSEQSVRTRQTKMSNQLAYRLLGAVTAVVLIAAITLLGQHRARSAGGAVAVQVTNATLATTDSSLTGAQVYLVQPTLSIANGSMDGFATVTVPTGKRLVAETVSAFRSGNGLTTQSLQLFVGRHDTLNGDFALPAVAPSSANSPGSTLAIRCYFDPGTTIFLGAHRSGTSGAETDTVTISGYLVNVP